MTHATKTGAGRRSGPIRALARQDRRRIAPVAVLLAVLAWSTGPNMVKGASANAVTIAFWRLLASIPIVLALLASRRSRPSPRAIAWGLIGGALFGLHVVVFFSAVQHTTVANATFAAALQPILVMLVAGALFGEKVGRTPLLWAPVSIAGLALVLFGAPAVEGRSLLGDVLAVANLFAWTAYFLASKLLRSKASAVEYQSGVAFGAVLFVVPFALITGGDLTDVHGTDWLLIVAIALVPGTLGHLTMNWAHPWVDASLSSLIVLAAPVFSALLAVVVHDEPLTWIQLVGGALCLVAVGAVVREGEARAGEVDRDATGVTEMATTLEGDLVPATPEPGGAQHPSSPE